MSYEKCKRCNEYRFNPQNCLCKSFTAWLKEDSENDGNHIFADNNKWAAEKFARRYDANTGEYHIVESGHAEVMVRDNQTQEVFEFEIEAYSEPVYCAKVC